MSRRGAAAALVIAALGVLVVVLQLAGNAPATAVGGTSKPAGEAGSSAPAVHSPIATSAPTPTLRPRATPAAPTAPAFVVGDGFWVDGSSTFHRSNDAWRTDECAADLCPNRVEVLTSPASEGISIGGTNGPGHRVAGATIDAVKAALAVAFPGAATEDIRIDGLPAVRLIDDRLNAAWALTLVGGRMYGFRAPDFFAPVGWTNLRTFTWDLHFLAPACWMTPCPKGAQSAPGEPLLAFDAAHGGTSWDERPPAIRSDPPGDASMRQFAWSCQAGCAGWLRVSIGTTATGPLVAPDGTLAMRLPGSDIDILRAAWRAARPDASFTPTTVGAEPAVIAWDPRRGGTELFIHRGYVIAITAEGTLRWDPAAGYMLEQFVAGLTLLP